MSRFTNKLKEIILAHREEFMRLYVNYSNLYSGLIIKKSYRVFYSDTEREYYERNMTDDLIRNYQDLYHKYISSTYPELRKYSRFITPRFLAEALGEPW